MCVCVCMCVYVCMCVCVSFGAFDVANRCDKVDRYSSKDA